MNIMCITGMSGAGKTKAMNTLEDVGYYCIGNMPPRFLSLLPQLLPDLKHQGSNKIAIVVDVRSRDMFPDFFAGLEALRREGVQCRILFLDAQDQVLIHRYKETRRRHPLQGEEIPTLQQAITQERRLLEGIRTQADFRIDTSQTRASQLRELVLAAAEETADSGRKLWVNLISFGFRNGLPGEADLVLDVRCLPNPYYIPQLRPHTGLEACVRDYVLGQPETQRLLARLKDLLSFLSPLYGKEGKNQLVIAIGCTGGHHRSVAIAQELGGFFQQLGHPVTVMHRDLDKPMGG